jgi:hypothetical protein
MDTPRVVLVIFFLLFLIFTPDTQRATPHQQLEARHTLDSERGAIDILNRTKYGDFAPAQGRELNLTGLRLQDGYAWDLLPKVQERAKRQAGVIFIPLGSSRRKGLKQKAPENTQSSNDLDIGSKESNLKNNVTMAEGFVPFYQNVSGIVTGKWVRSQVGNGYPPTMLNLKALTPQIEYTTTEFNRNITGAEGTLRIKFDEKKSEIQVVEKNIVREIKAELTIQDETSSGDGWEMTLHGLHYPQSGSILLSTTSDKFAGIFALPHFTLSETSYTLAQQILNRTLMASVLRQEEMYRYTMPTSPWSSSPGNPSDAVFPTPHCEYLIYLQQRVPTFETHASSDPHQQLLQLHALEDELRYPTGAFLGEVPLMAMSAVVFSPDCAFVLESKGPPEFPPQAGQHLRGPKLESYLRSAKRVVLLFSSVIAGQVFLLMRQMKEASTPSTRSRISFYSVAIMALGDGFVTIGFWTVSMVIDATFLVMITTAFLSFLCVSFFGMKFLMDIWTVQAPERQEAERRRAAANPPPRPAVENPSTTSVIITAAGADTLPLPATARRPTGAPMIILPPDQDLGAAEAEDAAEATTPSPAPAAGTPPAQTTIGTARREMSAMYSRFYFLLMGMLFVSLHATGWPTTLRTMYVDLLTGVYLSFWVPQIYRNVMRNCRKALRWEFVIGQSVLRVIPLVYFSTVTDNVLFIKNDWNTVYILVGWLWVQIWALISQEILGPRFFVPSGWAPPAYDYHPVLREDDEESGSTMPIGFTQATAESDSLGGSGAAKGNGQRIFDCAICMQIIDVPVVPAGGGESEVGASLTTGLFSRRAYMVTPCRHIFHSPCLEGWMRYRLQCPVCRENLPPL